MNKSKNFSLKDFTDLLCEKIYSPPYKLKKLFLLSVVFCISFAFLIESFQLVCYFFSAAVDFNIALSNNVKYVSLDDTKQLWIMAWSSVLMTAVFITAFILCCIIACKIIKRAFRNKQTAEFKDYMADTLHKTKSIIIGE